MNVGAAEALHVWPSTLLVSKAATISGMLEDAHVEHAFIGSFAVFTRNPALADIMGTFRLQAAIAQTGFRRRESDLDIVIPLQRSHLIHRQLDRAGYSMKRGANSHPGHPLRTYYSRSTAESIRVDVFTTPLQFTYGTFTFGQIQRIGGLPLFSDDLLLLLKLQIYPFRPEDAFDLLCLAETISQEDPQEGEHILKRIRRRITKDAGLRYRVPLAADEVLTTLQVSGTHFATRLADGAAFLHRLAESVSQMRLPWQLRWPQLASFFKSDPTKPRELESRD